MNPDQPGGKRGLLLRMERFSRRRWGLLFLMAALVLFGAFLLRTRIEFQSDLLALMPRGNPRVDGFRQALADFGSLDLLLVLLEANEGAGPEELEEFADVFASKLEALPGTVEYVEYRMAPGDAFLDLLYRNALLFVAPEQLPELAERLSQEAIDRRIREARLALSSPASPVAGEIVAQDPLGLMPFFLRRTVEQRRALRVDLSEGYYLAQDGRSLILLVKPSRPTQDLDFNEKLMASVREAARQTREELGDEGGEGALRVRYGGNYALVLEESDLIRKDGKFTLLFSLFAVSTLYFLCYRRFAALLYSSLPLLVGQAMTFGVAYFVLGGLNAISVFFTGLLMGLGTDFTIVMYARYVEERRNGATLAQGTERMVGETGLGVFTGAITSAGTFYAMCLSRFRGLFDFGFLIGTGILLCAAAIVFLLPAMITWNEGVRRRKVDSVRKLHLQSFGLEYLLPFAARHRVAVIASVMALTAAGAFFASRLEFDDSLAALRSNRTEASRVQERVAATFGANLSPMMAIARGRTLDEALERTQLVARRLAPWVENGTIAAVESILTHLPPVEQQLQVIQAVRAGGAAFEPKRVRASVTRALEENGFRPEPFDDYLERLEHLLTPERPIRIEDLDRQGMEHLVDRYVHRAPDEVRLVTYLIPADPKWRRRPPPGLIESVGGGVPGVIVTGGNVAAQELRKLFSREALRSVAAGLAIVFVLLMVDFRSLKLTLIAMVQVVSAVLMMLGLMRLAGIKLNNANSFVATMILGVGIDYSIHLVHRLQETGGRIERGVLETGKAVVLAALTNVAGFGTLILGTYPAMRSFGLVALFGSLTSLLTALTLVPALMAGRAKIPGRMKDER